MNRTEIKKTLDQLVDIDNISDQHIAAAIKILFNLVEVLAEQSTAQQATIQKQADEINRLKGEQGKPDIRQQTKDDQNQDHSSEDDRKKRENKEPPKPKIKKKQEVKIDRQVILKMDPEALPADAEFKGYETRVIQDIKISPDNIKFLLATYYSKSQKKSFITPLLDGYHGEFGPGIRSVIITLYRDSGMTETAIKRFFSTFGISIAASTISNMITENHERFHEEKENIIDAGLQAGPYQHIDDTGCRVNGKNQYAHILCSVFFTAFFTRPKKDRLTILEILCREELKFEFNNDTYDLMSELGLSNKRLIELKKVIPEKTTLSRAELDNILKQLFPNPKKHRTSRRIITEAAALIYYRNSDFAIEHLICDDAPQFNKIAKFKSLCWIHEGRHYKKLDPIIAVHRKSLDDFNEKFWDYYAALLDYKHNPSEILAKQLSKDFDSLFSTTTGYDALDARIAMTLLKKESLLLVLRFPFLSLHNNPAELGARVQARMRDINLQTISANGTKTKDTFATIVQTAKKLGVNIYDYIYDRISEAYKMPSLASLITQQANANHNTA